MNTLAFIGSQVVVDIGKEQIFAAQQELSTRTASHM
jgi:hypothetical protein